MTLVPVELGARRYDVLIEAGALDRAAELLTPYARDRLIVVTDETIAAAQLPREVGAAPDAGLLRRMRLSAWEAAALSTRAHASAKSPKRRRRFAKGSGQMATG